MGIPTLAVCRNYRADLLFNASALLWIIPKFVDFIIALNMKNTGKFALVFGILLLLLLVVPDDLVAQCPMCRMSAESNLKNGGTDGQGLNAGILYMLAMPYTLVAVIGFWWWRNRKKSHNSGAEDLSQYN